MAQENALNRSARFAHSLDGSAAGPGGFGGRILRADQTCCVRIESTRGALRHALAEHRLPSVGRNGDNPLPHKIKAAKEWPRAEMARPAKVHEKLDQRLAELPKFAGEFVDARLPVAVALPVQKAGAALCQGEKNGLESGGEGLGFLVGVNARGCRSLK